MSNNDSSIEVEVIVLVAGRVLMTGSPQEVMASSAVRTVYLGGAGSGKAAHA